MAQGTHNELNLYEEAKAGLFSLIQQTVAVFLGFVLMLLATGGAPSGFAIALSFCLGTGFVSWSEQKRVRNLKAVDSSITPKESETLSILIEQSHRNSNPLDIQNLRQQELLEGLAILQRELERRVGELVIWESELASTVSASEKFRLDERSRNLMSEIEHIQEMMSEIERILERVRLVEEDYYNYDIRQVSAVGQYAHSDNNTLQLVSKTTLAEAAEEVQQLLEQLEQTNPSATDAEKISYVNDETTPSFKRRVIGALQASGEAAIEEFLDNPYVSVGKAIVKGWVKPE